MHISRLSLVNYRNFSNASLHFKDGINTIIGENGSGKTNVFRAMRLLLDDELMRFSYKLAEGDFNRSLGDWRGHWIIISLEFSNLSKEEAIQALFVHGGGDHAEELVSKATYNLIFRPNIEKRLQLSKLNPGDKAGLDSLLSEITIDEYETVFTGKSTADFSDSGFYTGLVGDFDTVNFPDIKENPTIGIKIPHQLSIAKEVSFTFVKALRDVVSDFQNNRRNPLLKLLKSKSEELDQKAFEPIADKVVDLNDSIESLKDVQDVKVDIKKTIREAVGETYSPTSMSIKSDLSSEADQLFQSLKLFIGETDDGHEGSIHELSLGGANLIYLTLKLLEFKYQKAKLPVANFLLIEEPEAHIHTHIQKTLFDKVNYGDTQIIYSTHSTHISEVSKIEKSNILSRNSNQCVAFNPSNGLHPKEVRNVERYLDAVRSNLLFAKSVILVEGDAEEILIPALVKEVLGVSLDELGVSLINVRSTGFENISVLFHDDRIKKKCVILTDLDRAIGDVSPNFSDHDKIKRLKKKMEKSQNLGASRKKKLDELCKDNKWLDVYYADYTFEVDFINSNNSVEVIAAIDDIYIDEKTKKDAKAELESSDLSVFGSRILKMAENAGKGWFSIILSNHIDHETFIPIYIQDAVFGAAGEINSNVWVDIFRYRLELSSENIDTHMNEINKFSAGELSLEEIAKYLNVNIPDDQLSEVLDGI